MTTTSVDAPKKNSEERATSFEGYLRQQQIFGAKMHAWSGVDQSLIQKIILYAQSLQTPGSGGYISDLVFRAQMSQRLYMTSHMHLNLMHGAVKRTASTPGSIHVDDYVKLLCMLHSYNLQPKVDFVFTVYDIDCDGELSSKEITFLLKDCVVSVEDISYSDDALKELVDITMAVLDVNRDGHISLEEFRQYATENVLYMEILGQVLPNDEYVYNFMDKLRRMSATSIRQEFLHERLRCLQTPPALIKPSRMRKLYRGVTLDMAQFY